MGIKIRKEPFDDLVAKNLHRLTRRLYELSRSKNRDLTEFLAVQNDLGQRLADLAKRAEASGLPPHLAQAAIKATKELEACQELDAGGLAPVFATATGMTMACLAPYSESLPHLMLRPLLRGVVWLKLW